MHLASQETNGFTDSLSKFKLADEADDTPTTTSEELRYHRVLLRRKKMKTWAKTGKSSFKLSFKLCFMLFAIFFKQGTGRDYFFRLFAST